MPNLYLFACVIKACVCREYQNGSSFARSCEEIFLEVMNRFRNLVSICMLSVVQLIMQRARF